ncbi:hypothetical protein A0U40_03460 [[Bacillus] sp. KCTC 13219]|uniref:DUF5592 family protein n=1 Tax=Metasolibacillus fluoroglycofenilyticus TaxID=1239396 RepID=UPI000791536F|nr:DUF5592 family protein [Metasolibacillus fluoroglycofenilyticus]KYG92009.1 hypothetical protein A0U40_03460 [[Bacillus] sp. KCTC 13219]
MYEIPKEIKAKPKLMGLELKELIIVGVSFFLFLTIFRDLVHGVLVIPYLVIASGTLFWLVLPSGNNPRLKNYQSIRLFFQHKQSTYHALAVQKVLNEQQFGEDGMLDEQ